MSSRIIAKPTYRCIISSGKTGTGEETDRHGDSYKGKGWEEDNGYGPDGEQD